MRVDKLPQDLNRRSSSAWAKKALASRRISLALRSSRTSRSSAFNRGAGNAIAHANVDLVLAALIMKYSAEEFCELAKPKGLMIARNEQQNLGKKY